MPGRKEELIELIRKYRMGKASPAEVNFLEKYYAYFDKEEKLSLSEEEIESTGKSIFANIQYAIQQPLVVPIYKRVSYRIAAAAAVLIIGLGTYLYLNKTHQSPETTAVVVKHDVAPPAVNRATITLANGQKVFLDSATNGMLAQQENINLIKTDDGQIVYEGALKQAQGDMVYNTLTNPRGSKVINMTLSDGTKVWLNAGSSVTYPIAFTNKERKVSMNGEAYFEVASLTPKGGQGKTSFVVEKGNMSVTVLGTHFNVNAYDDETDIKVTLLEGSVQVTNTGVKEMLKPGEQAAAYSNGKIDVDKSADLEQVMAWKDGRFYFDGADIKAIMRQLTRWYDVEVEYQAEVKYSFVAKIKRDVPVSELLKILELTELVHFKIEGKKVTVLK